MLRNLQMIYTSEINFFKFLNELIMFHRNFIAVNRYRKFCFIKHPSFHFSFNAIWTWRLISCSRFFIHTFWRGVVERIIDLYSSYSGSGILMFAKQERCSIVVGVIVIFLVTFIGFKQLYGEPWHDIYCTSYFQDTPFLQLHFPRACIQISIARGVSVMTNDFKLSKTCKCNSSVS